MKKTYGSKGLIRVERNSSRVILLPSVGTPVSVRPLWLMLLTKGTSGLTAVGGVIDVAAGRSYDTHQVTILALRIQAGIGISGDTGGQVGTNTINAIGVGTAPDFKTCSILTRNPDQIDLRRGEGRRHQRKFGTVGRAYSYKAGQKYKGSRHTPV